MQRMNESKSTTEEFDFIDESVFFHEENILVNKTRGRFASRQLLQNFIVVPVEVPVYPELRLNITEDGEIKADFEGRRKNNDVFTKKLPMILDPHGVPLLAENLFLHHKMKTTESYQTVHRKANGLLAFLRFCYMSEWVNDKGIEEQMTYRSLTAEPELGAPWLFGDWMFDNLHIRDTQTGIIIERGIAPSTAIFNIRTVAEFYGWLISNKMLTVRENYIPYRPVFFNVQYGWRNTSKRQTEDKKILSHILNSPQKNKIHTNDIRDEQSVIIATSDLVRRFSNYANELGKKAYEKLKPMTPSDRLIFESKLKKYEKNPAHLMCELCIKTGLRVKEAVTFPESVVRQPVFGEEVIPVSISEKLNGCLTKFKKQRTINVPADLMRKLHEYKLSDKRLNALEKHNIEVDENFNQVNHHGRLFVSNRCAGSYDKNTLQCFFSDIRTEINAEPDFSNIIELNSLESDIVEFHEKINNYRNKAIPQWYYRPHDLRSTFATRWLLDEHQKTGLPFEMLLDELSDLMGHKDIEQTRKYVQFLDRKILKYNSAARKNAAAILLY